MKKLFFACAIAISAAAMATSGTTTVDVKLNNTDTVPRPKDTLRKPIPDSISYMVSHQK